MKIKSLFLSGFRNIQNTRIEIDGITALVSPNNYGKSNILHGLAFAFEFIVAGERQRKAMLSSKSAIPLTKVLEREPFRFEVEFHDPKFGDYAFVRYGFELAWYRDDGQGQRILDEWIDMRTHESVKYTGYLKRGVGKYRNTKESQALRNINLEHFQLAVDMLSAVDDLAYANVVDSIRKLSFRSCSAIDSDRYFEPFPFEPIGVAQFSFDALDISTLLAKLKSENSNRFFLFVEAAKNLFPEILEIEIKTVKFGEGMKFVLEKDQSNQEDEDPPFKIREELHKVYVKVKHLNQTISAEYLSEGTRRLFGLLAIMFSSDANTHLIGIEELESSIHPRLLEQTLNLLHENLGDLSLLVTSHSPYLIQYLKLDKIYIGVPNDEGVARFQPVQKGKMGNLVRNADDLGLSAGEYLFELMSMGKKYEATLARYVGE